MGFDKRTMAELILAYGSARLFCRTFFVLDGAGGGATSVRRSRGGYPDIQGSVPQPHGEDGFQQEVW